MNPEEVEEQLNEMFTNVPTHLLESIKGFIVILHGDKGTAINMSNEILNASIDEKITIIISLLNKIIDDPNNLLTRLRYRM